MEGDIFLNKIHRKLYLKYMLFTTLVFMVCNVFLLKLTIEKKREDVESKLLAKGKILKKMAVEDMEYCVNWMDAFSIFKSPVFYSGKLDEDYYEDALKTISHSNISINEVFFLDKDGNKIKGYSRGKRKEEIDDIPDNTKKRIKRLREKEMLAETPFENKGIILFCTPVYLKEKIIGFLGTSYSADGYLNKIHKELKEIFYYDNIVTISANKGVLFTSPKNSLVTEKYTKISTNYKIIKGLQDEIEKDKIKLYIENVSEGDVNLNVYFLEKQSSKVYIGYFEEELIMFILVAYLLWRYTKEKVKNIRNNKRIVRMNRILMKEIENKEVIFSIIGHDLRGPFTSVLGYFRLLDKNLEKYNYEKIKFMIKTVERDVENLSELTENLLRWSSIQLNRIESKPHYIFLNKLVEKIINTYNSQLKSKNITLRYRSPKDIKVWADDDLTESIFRNLLSNAIKYSYFNSEILIEIQEEKERIILIIQDFGVGMSNFDTKGFSEKNYISTRGTNNEKGIGFGLYIIRKFSKINENKVSFISKKGKGTKVEIEFKKLPNSKMNESKKISHQL